MKILLLLLLTITISCVHKVNIVSSPSKADVYLTDIDKKKEVLIGTTPLKFNIPTSVKTVTLNIRKEGYLSKQLVFPLQNSENVKASVTMETVDEKWINQRMKGHISNMINAKFKKYLELQSAVLSKNTAKVIKLRKEMDEDFKDISLYHSLLGNYYYLIGDKVKARKKYEKAKMLDPHNEEAIKMLIELK